MPVSWLAEFIKSNFFERLHLCKIRRYFGTHVEFFPRSAQASCSELIPEKG